jgi:hypothetical protein
LIRRKRSKKKSSDLFFLPADSQGERMKIKPEKDALVRYRKTSFTGCQPLFITGRVTLFFEIS